MRGTGEVEKVINLELMDEKGENPDWFACLLAFLSARLPMIVLSPLFIRVANLSFQIYVVDSLLTIGACPLLYWKLRKADDIYSMSTEIRKVGALALLALGKYTKIVTIRDLELQHTCQEGGLPTAQTLGHQVLCLLRGTSGVHDKTWTIAGRNWCVVENADVGRHAAGEVDMQRSILLNHECWRSYTCLVKCMPPSIVLLGCIKVEREKSSLILQLVADILSCLVK